MLPVQVMAERRPRTGIKVSAIHLPFKLNNLQALSWARSEHKKLGSAGGRVYSTAP